MLAGDVEKRENCLFTLFPCKYLPSADQDGSNIVLRVRQPVFLSHQLGWNVFHECHRSSWMRLWCVCDSGGACQAPSDLTVHHLRGSYL